MQAGILQNSNKIGCISSHNNSVVDLVQNYAESSFSLFTNGRILIESTAPYVGNAGFKPEFRFVQQRTKNVPFCYRQADKVLLSEIASPSFDAPGGVFSLKSDNRSDCIDDRFSSFAYMSVKKARVSWLYSTLLLLGFNFKEAGRHVLSARAPKLSRVLGRWVDKSYKEFMNLERRNKISFRVC